MLTKEEARKKICPYKLYILINENSDMNEVYCETDSCMAWKYVKTKKVPNGKTIIAHLSNNKMKYKPDYDEIKMGFAMH